MSKQHGYVRISAECDCGHTVKTNAKPKPGDGKHNMVRCRVCGHINHCKPAGE